MFMPRLFWIAPALLFCNASWPSEQPPAASPQFLAGIESDYGNRYAADGNYRQAIRFYRRALTLLYAGRRDEAEAIHARLVGLNPQSAARLRLEIDAATR
jgi:hypothetical protein